MITCSECGSSETANQSNSRGKSWYSRQDGKKGRLCSRCYLKATKWKYIGRKDGRTISFKGKEILYPFKVRTGVCSNCGRSKARGEIKRTILHHEEYDDKNPLAHTVELCNHCHNRVHKKNEHGGITAGNLLKQRGHDYFVRIGQMSAQARQRKMLPNFKLASEAQTK